MTLPAGEIRTGFAISAASAALAQWGAASRGGAAALALHVLCAGLVYLLFVNLTKRKLGAPLVAAALFAAHPVAASTLADAHGARVAGGVALGLLAGVLLARTPLDKRLLWPALAAYSAALPLAPETAPIPFLVAAAVVAYHGLEPSRLFTRRLLPRFAVFVVPLAVFLAWPVDGGAARGFGAVAGDAASIALPTASRIDVGAVVGAAVAAALVLLGLVRLHANPKAAWPLLAAGVSFVAAATMRDAWGAPAPTYAAAAFVALAVAEAVEEIYYRFGGALAAPLMLVLYAALATLSHLRAAGP